MREYSVDLHVHTCLSPCGASSMVPPAIVRSAREAGLGAIGIVDHNSAENVAAVTAAAAGDVVVIGGMEITTAEEVHVLALFPTAETLDDMQRVVYAHLDGRNDPARFGAQYVVDREGYITGACDRLLAGATDLPVETLVDLVHDRSGLVIACHVDRESYSVIGQLGFIPASIDFDAVELSPAASDEFRRRAYPAPVVTASDAHEPTQIGAAASTLLAGAPSFEELVRAFRGEGGRSMRDGRTTKG